MSVPGPLVSTQWLADHLGGDNLVVLDATVLSVEGGGHVAGDEEYLVRGHVPGAYSADLIEQFSDPEASFSFTRPSREQFERVAGEHGISNESTVVVYDTAFGAWASRLWWLLRSFGHDDVAVLDGGLTQWRHEGRELETGYVAPIPRTFVAQERDGFWATRHDVEEVVAGTRRGALICAVPDKEFSGEAPVRRRAGHIPGSVSIPARTLIDPETRRLLNAAALAERLGSVASDQPVILYCAAGIAATSDALALTVLGRTDISVYDGSLNEWAADPDAVLTLASSSA
jgi:thiosulfate/3-mercaptopyruvate sulfurtransferase